MDRARTWKPFSYWTRPHDTTSGGRGDVRTPRPPAGTPEVGVDPVGDVDDVFGGQLESRDELFDDELRGRDDPIGLEGEPPLDRVDVGRVAERELPAVTHPLGAVHREHERHVVPRGQRVRSPAEPPVVTVHDVGPPSLQVTVEARSCLDHRVVRGRHPRDHLDRWQPRQVGHDSNDAHATRWVDSEFCRDPRRP